MSYNINDLKYVDVGQLCQWIRQGNKTNLGEKLVVVDVRGHDHIGGHIKGSVNIASSKFVNEMANLKQRMENDEIKIVVFHCAQSQQRGPSAALKFLRYSDGEFDVRILRGGFIEWQQRYGLDTGLTSGYIKDLWM
ncbi:similar to Saccharomyces cerevisiae YGR203W YCH1 Phosphatase with sequence similarity to Cdc25p, Arr2p and Mih1p [Maudiozyma barnettii]|uniref:Similar to Saccharomyces cerevisiae YGR203W YCH1 Phosphatase with sequence similarity to Cdc25p, Arr2p and Mih1p n=1 Tax=Maudiozyma barnettii TaxID=61262 RepID=A0A8H2VJB2_9SACH|nr:phosphatase YCH1 [Kazachstania barnettii]CAB4256453.1 similar to Saccharomyces cerevisiae YGR203W YCH1 Phosphatase with sequence similarity to Cdc25p, Arr2p and Mih1p [Kazachstania barnettii]CAD1785062.1 similar to Saccharomyces cerevisiae YGR203W YCH1 Phosphatase with sequence similarity to Cdc25p, Arr2p and Mih1p [Kazachstania barnettii]